MKQGMEAFTELQKNDVGSAGARRLMILSAAALLLSACSEPAKEAATEEASPAPAEVVAPAIASDPNRMALFGDLHVHTGLSFDAYIFGTRSTPDSAYEYAKGQPLQHPAGFSMQLKAPLDFQAVTDHDLFMGVIRAMDDPNTSVGQHPLGKELQAADTAQARLTLFQKVIPFLRGNSEDSKAFLDEAIMRDAWKEVVDAAERHNQPGSFTTFIAYEYTSSGPERENLHRNVFFKGAGPELPFSVLMSNNPEDLWDWLDSQRDAGHEALAIPHNSNGSNGMMFDNKQWDGSPLSALYAEQRMRNEPLVEVTQVKGTSETHPLLSPNDEWADFELMEVRIATSIPSKAPGSYVREALRNGLVMQATQGFNPYKFGMVAASDTHVGAGSFDEHNYWSKVGFVDGTAELRGSVPLKTPGPEGNTYATGNSFETWAASGLAGVWAESNTRDSIYEAFRRKETFATTGPRIRVRLFGGFGLDQVASGDVPSLYAKGVPQGSDLPPSQAADEARQAPVFHATALRDSASAPLQRLQIVKGWVENGEGREQVFDVACADGLTPDPQTFRCPDNDATVDISSCAFSSDKGAAELSAVWQDPSFDPKAHAFYYVRALENPTCRWSTWDAVRAGVAPRESLKSTVQERAWTSPIWYSPGA